MACSFKGSSFFERRLRGRIALRVRKPGLLARQVQPLEQAGEPPLAIADAIDSFDMLAQVSQAPGAHPIALRLRSTQDMGFQRRLLTPAMLTSINSAPLLSESRHTHHRKLESAIL